MNKKEITQLILDLRRKDSKLLSGQELFIRTILAQKLEDEQEDFIDSPIFTEREEVLEALLKDVLTNY